MKQPVNLQKEKQNLQYIKLQEKIKKLSGESTRGQWEQDFREGNDQSRVRAYFSSKALLNNFNCLTEMCSSAQILPMVKANAYGHGVDWIIKTLVDQNQLVGFGVATLLEGIQVRKILRTLKKKQKRILVFSQASVWDESICQLAEEYELTLVISSFDFLSAFYEGGWHLKIAHHLKFNTGMNRLGIGMSDLERSVNLCSKKKDQSKLEGVCTHFAEAENVQSELTEKQIERFKKIYLEFKKKNWSLYFHCSNSAAIFNEKKLKLLDWNEWVRPGIALYGYPPASHFSEKSLIPVVTLKARLIEVRKLAPQECLGYSGQFVNLEKTPVWIGVLSVGYADGLLRSFGGTIEVIHRKTQNTFGAYAVLQGRPDAYRFVGRVSMDLSFVLGDAQMKKGDWVEYWGSSIDTWAQANKIGTIPYEVLTSIGTRVGRVYE